MKLSKPLRYLQLASAIKNSPAQTPEQLWQNLGIKKAQFNRDKKDLEKIGFIFHYDRKQRRFVITKEPFLPVYNLTLTETFALTMAVRQLSAAGDYLLTYGAIEAISKIIANAPGPQRELLSESMRESVLREGFGCQEHVLQDLQKALLDQRRVIIQYQPPPADAPKEYEIDPYQMYFKRRALYLDAYCPETKDYRVFRLNRVSDVRFSDMGFTRHVEYNFTERHRYSFSVFVGDTVQRVRVRFSKERAPYIREACWHRSQQLTPQPDGSLLFEVEVNEPREVGWWVLQWGADAEVLEPESLRQELAQVAQQLVGVYGKKQSVKNPSVDDARESGGDSSYSPSCRRSSSTKRRL
jgi:predicted DNA-binding transcriptional regulator YafY